MDTDFFISAQARLHYVHATLMFTNL